MIYKWLHVVLYIHDICMYACMHVWMYGCMDVRMHGWMDVCSRAQIACAGQEFVGPGTRHGCACRLRASGAERQLCHAHAGHSGLPSLDMTAIMGCKVAMLSIGSEDMLALYTANEFATGSRSRWLFGFTASSKDRCPSCKGIWTTKRQPGSSCTSPNVMAFMGSKDMPCCAGWS